MKRFLLGILAGLIIAGVTGVVLIFALVRLARREPEAPKSAVLVLRLEGELPEAPAVGMPLPALEDRSPLTVVEIWSALRRAARDPRIKGVMLKPRGLGAGWAKVEEVRMGLEGVRKAGKPVYAWLTSPNTREYYLASVADRVFLSPEDMLDVKGVRAETTYYKGTLDKLGIEFEVEHMGKYKDAGDTFTRTSMSPETKEALNPVLDEVFGRFCSGVAQGRKLKAAEVQAMVDDGPFIAPQAIARHLVDELTFERNADEAIARKAGVGNKQTISARDFLRTASDLSEKKTRNIAYLVAQGDIIRGSVVDLFGEDQSVNPGAMSRRLRQITDDPSIRGILLRVDSPGGDAIASDEILEELIRASGKKPLVISMSDVAASGGYYIAMTGDPVVAYPGTLTGSIGVIYGKANFKGLYSKIGLSKDVLKRGRFADIDSEAQPLTPEARAKLRESIAFIYEGFLKRVGSGRHRKPSEIEPLAQGRVWIGADAKRNGLVDELGGLDRAVELLKKRAGLTADENVRLIPYPRPAYVLGAGAEPCRTGECGRRSGSAHPVQTTAGGRGAVSGRRFSARDALSGGCSLERVGRGDAGRLQGDRHLLERRLVDLRNAALVDAEHAADLFHRHLVGVVHDDDFLVALRQHAHRFAQP